MDILLANTLLQRKDRREGFKLSYVPTIISMGLSAYGAFLSWTCNAGLPTASRVLYAFFAWLFGLMYIIFYVIFRAGSCPAR